MMTFAPSTAIGLPSSPTTRPLAHPDCRTPGGPGSSGNPLLDRVVGGAGFVGPWSHPPADAAATTATSPHQHTNAGDSPTAARGRRRGAVYVIGTPPR